MVERPLLFENESSENPFKDTRPYFSASIRGAKFSTPEFPLQIVRFMQERGADVLTEHVAQMTEDDMFEVFNNSILKSPTVRSRAGVIPVSFWV